MTYPQPSQTLRCGQPMKQVTRYCQLLPCKARTEHIHQQQAPCPRLLSLALQAGFNAASSESNGAADPYNAAYGSFEGLPSEEDLKKQKDAEKAKRARVSMNPGELGPT